MDMLTGGGMSLSRFFPLPLSLSHYLPVLAHHFSCGRCLLFAQAMTKKQNPNQFFGINVLSTSIPVWICCNELSTGRKVEKLVRCLWFYMFPGIWIVHCLICTFTRTLSCINTVWMSPLSWDVWIASTCDKGCTKHMVSQLFPYCARRIA